MFSPLPGMDPGKSPDRRRNAFHKGCSRRVGGVCPEPLYPPISDSALLQHSTIV